MDKCRQDKCCLDKYHRDNWNLAINTAQPQLVPILCRQEIEIVDYWIIPLQNIFIFETLISFENITHPPIPRLICIFLSQTRIIFVVDFFFR